MRSRSALSQAILLQTRGRTHAVPHTRSQRAAVPETPLKDTPAIGRASLVGRSGDEALPRDLYRRCKPVTRANAHRTAARPQSPSVTWRAAYGDAGDVGGGRVLLRRGYGAGEGRATYRHIEDVARGAGFGSFEGFEVRELRLDLLGGQPIHTKPRLGLRIHPKPAGVDLEVADGCRN